MNISKMIAKFEAEPVEGLEVTRGPGNVVFIREDVGDSEFFYLWDDELLTPVGYRLLVSKGGHMYWEYNKDEATASLRESLQQKFEETLPCTS